MSGQPICRYARQIILPQIGEAGQKKIGAALAVVIGCGALGALISSALVRAGVGRVRIIDRDFIEYHNLQRQILFTEDDIRDNLPKAAAAARHLQAVNSSVQVEGLVSDVNHRNIEELVSGAQVIVDGLDNLETRLLVNDVALKLKIPWIYGGAVATCGMTRTIIPAETACFQCMVPDTLPGGQILTCDTAGVLGPAAWMVASLEAAEALKILVGSPSINRNLLILDVWDNHFSQVSLEKSPACAACRGEYRFLEGKSTSKTTSLCGQNAVQVLAAAPTRLDFSRLAERLSNVGRVRYNAFMLEFSTEGADMLVFADGRAIIKNTVDEGYARGIYAKYVGT